MRDADGNLQKVCPENSKLEARSFRAEAKSHQVRKRDLVPLLAQE